MTLGRDDADLKAAIAELLGNPGSFFGGWMAHKKGLPCPDEATEPNAVRGWPQREAQKAAEFPWPTLLPSLALALALGTSACTEAQLVRDGQLVCMGEALIVAVIDVAGGPVMADGASEAFVHAVCSALDSVPVPPPAPVLPVAVVRLP